MLIERGDLLGNGRIATRSTLIGSLLLLECVRLSKGNSLSKSIAYTVLHIQAFSVSKKTEHVREVISPS